MKPQYHPPLRKSARSCGSSLLSLGLSVSLYLQWKDMRRCGPEDLWSPGDRVPGTHPLLLATPWAEPSWPHSVIKVIPWHICLSGQTRPWIFFSPISEYPGKSWSMGLQVFSFLYLCLSSHVYTYMCVQIYIHMCAYMWRPEVNVFLSWSPH